MLRRLDGPPGQDQPADFLDRLPARLLSAATQMAKIIASDVPALTPNRQALLDAMEDLLALVPALNSLEGRFEVKVRKRTPLTVPLGL